MKKIILPIMFTFLLIFQANAQVESGNRSCSVVCLNEQWIPESYSVNAKTVIPLNAKGVLSVHETLDVQDRNQFKRNDFIEFKVAIFKKEFGSLVSFSKDTYQQLEVREVLSMCEKGDQIFILLTDRDHYSLPHYQIEVL